MVIRPLSVAKDADKVKQNRISKQMKKYLLIGLVIISFCFTKNTYASFVEGAHFNNTSSSISGIATPDPNTYGADTPIEAYTTSTIIQNLHEALDGNANGNLHYKDFPNPGTNNFTVCVWAQFGSSFSQNDYRFLNYTNSDGSKLAGIDINWTGTNGSLIFETYDGTISYAGATSTDWRGSMHRFCGKRVGGINYIYVDGVDVTTTHVSLGSAQDLSSLNNIWIFQGIPGSSNSFADELSYFNTALTPTEFTTDYNFGYGTEYGLKYPEISFVVPAQSSTSPYDFSDWIINVNNFPSSTQGISFIVYYKEANSNNWFPTDNSGVFYPQDYGYSTSTSQDFAFTKKIPLNKNTTTTYEAYAVANIQYNGSVQHFISNQVSFEIGTLQSTSTTNYIKTVSHIVTSTNTTSSLIGWTDMCQDENGNALTGWTGSICYVISLVVEVRPEAALALQNEFTSFKLIFPFSLISGFYSSINDKLNTNIPTADSHIDFTYQGKTITLINSSTLTSELGSNTKTFIFTIISWFIWFCLGLALLALIKLF